MSILLWKQNCSTQQLKALKLNDITVYNEVSPIHFVAVDVGGELEPIPAVSG